MSDPPPVGHVPVSGSEREPLPGARPAGDPDRSQPIEVTVLLRPRSARAGLAEPRAQGSLTRAEFAERFGSSAADLAQIDAFARQHGLTVVESSGPRRTVVLGGTVQAMSAAFGVTLRLFDSPHGTYRGRTGPIHVPATLAPIVQAVLGLDDRPVAQPHFRYRDAEVIEARVPSASYTPTEVARLYNYPTAWAGQGQCVALIELGGGYTTADLDSYFASLGIQPSPSVVSVSVDGGANRPGAAADGEVDLDIEIVGAIAPRARIAVYFAPNTDRGFLDAITTAVHDTANSPSVISISWGSPEVNWTAQALAAFDGAFQDAAALGVTVCAASGDNGSSDGVADGLAHVDFPSSSPHALGCGGTTLAAADGAIADEIVWNEPGHGATGGGVSDVFPLPDWQQAARVPRSANPSGRIGRGVPDVSGNADPLTGYRVRVDGHDRVVGGTSAVAPLWAALIALINQAGGRPVGYLNPTLYQLGADRAFQDITRGDNGAYHATPAWDACTGLGRPDGSRLLQALASSPRPRATPR